MGHVKNDEEKVRKMVMAHEKSTRSFKPNFIPNLVYDRSEQHNW